MGQVGLVLGSTGLEVNDSLGNSLVCGFCLLLLSGEFSSFVLKAVEDLLLEFVLYARADPVQHQSHSYTSIALPD